MQSGPSSSRYFARFAASLAQLPRTLALVLQAAPGWTAAWFATLLIQGLLPVATVYLTRPVVNGLVAAIRSGGNWRPVVILGILMAILLLLTGVLGSAMRWVRTAQADLVQDHITSLIHRKSVEADLGFYESPDFYDHLFRARAESSYRPTALLETLGGALQNGLTLIAMLVVLAGYGLWLPAALMVSTLPAFAVVLRYAAQQHEFRLRTTPIERRAGYYDWLLTSGETAAEVRLYSLGEHFQSGYRDLRRRLNGERLHLAGSQGLAEIFAGFSALAVTAAAFLWMAWKTIQGRFSLGDLALFYQAFQQGLRLARTLLENVGQFYQNSLFLGNLFEFLELTPTVVSPAESAAMPVPLRVGIQFTGVTFRYPDTRRIALRDFSLSIPAGRLVAIVGPNGAGKSTLVKLLCRFYDPEEGSITVDGVDLRSFAVDELRERISVLFQQPVHYNATVRENISLGHLASTPTNAGIEAAAKAAGAEPFIQGLPQGYENLLGHWFEKGTELSVGEWQRIALARAFLREAPILLLDEPTSAMDPWAEAEWLQGLRGLAAGRTAILITHRFTTAMLADEIHVMEAGRLVESGSHRQLIANGGRYAAWSAAQSAS